MAIVRLNGDRIVWFSVGETVADSEPAEAATVGLSQIAEAIEKELQDNE